MPIDINQLINDYGYFGFFLFGILNFVIPSEPVLTTAGFLISQERLNYFLVILATVCGSFIKTTTIYSTGYFIGKEFLIKYSRFTGFKIEYLDWVKSKVQKYGYRIVLPLQFVPYIRRFVSAPCGLLKLDYKRFMFYNMIGVTLWFSFLISLGYFFGKGYSAVSPVFRNYGNYLAIFISFIFTIFFLYELWSQFRKKR